MAYMYAELAFGEWLQIYAGHQVMLPLNTKTPNLNLNTEHVYELR